MELKLWFACAVLVTCSEVNTLDVTVQQFKESPGLYYFIGELQLYNKEWTIVTYINLETVDENFETQKLRADVR
jgi:hypothetical protein